MAAPLQRKAALVALAASVTAAATSALLLFEWRAHSEETPTQQGETTTTLSTRHSRAMGSGTAFGRNSLGNGVTHALLPPLLSVVLPI